MRAPLCCEATEFCTEDQRLLGPDSESNSEIHSIEKSLEKSHSSKTTVFGICLENLMGTTPVVAPQIPFILSRLCRYIEQHGLHYKRLFLEGDEKNLESLKIKFIELGNAPLEEDGNVAAAAKLLIIFFEELPEPLIPTYVQPDFIKDMEKLSLNSVDCVSHLKGSVKKLPNASYNVLKYLSRFLLRVSSHEEFNGMSPDNLGLVFGPVIFRVSSTDDHAHLSVKSVVNHFVQDYYAIFDDAKNVPLEDYDASPPFPLQTKTRRQLPCPSSVMPVMALMPLSVVIPTADSKLEDEKVKGNIPVLLIENQGSTVTGKNESKGMNSESIVNKGTSVTRKRKERRLSGEDLQQRSSSEERPQATALVSLDEIELMRRCSSHEEMIEGMRATVGELNAVGPPKMMVEPTNSYSLSIELLENEKNHSPHPPNAKRREVEPTVQKSDLVLDVKSWRNPHHMVIPDDSSFIPCEKPTSLEPCQLKSKQNSIAEFEEKSTMDCDTSEHINGNNYSSNSDVKEFQVGQKPKIPRSASFPVSGLSTANEESSESESSSLSLSWSMLFESEDTEPMRSEHRFSWPLTKDEQEDNALLSPSVQSLRNYYEAPLSPSAYRSYLSYRSTHLDPSVPPSPPVEQEDFAKPIIESAGVNDSIKQLTKKMHSIKKKIRKFDEKFEAEFGYKPSHAEKANNHEAKKLMSDLHKTRKELKVLKEESHLERVSPASNWHATLVPHILEDTTNHLQDSSKSKPSVEESFGATLKSLSDERADSKRPDSFEDMSTEQVKDEKVAIQKALLDFESIHGKPSSKADRNTTRPLYDRYRSVKRFLVRSGSFPVTASKNKDLCSELQPILEHETMDFSSLQNRVSTDSQVEASEKSEKIKLTQEIEVPKSDEERNKSKPSSFLALKYDNSNIHELPLSDMIFQLQQVKSEKRHLRKILKEFESEFFRLNGRKVLKEDRAPIETLYGEYKLVKARLRLLDALVSKHDQHRLM